MSIPQKMAATLAVELAKPELHSARHLLQAALGKGATNPLTVRMVQVEHMEALRKSPIGRDFTLMTAAGVEFKIHSIMLIGGPKMLEEGLFPGGAPQPNPPTVINLPAHFHPILVDRLVSFIYDSDYQMDASNRHATTLTPETFTFLNAGSIPSHAPAVTALANTHTDIFNLHMCALAEDIDYPALQLSAFAKLASPLVISHRRSPAEIKAFIDAVFPPPGAPARICKDSNGALHNLCVAAVVAHDLLNWTGPKGEERRKEYRESVQGPEYAEFWAQYRAVKEEDKDVLEQATARKDAVEKRLKAMEQRMAGQVAVSAGAKAKGEVGKGAGVSRRRAPRRPRENGRARGGKADDDGDVEME